ncbi:Uncharacterised protein [Mycolicibacterium vanbaalenii]|uniref:Phosphonate metabolism PhnG n=1 Tax=Mycolicibacterium vanbaalenii TaxID=110539 RepID=A0A5S9QWT6_MYCVN|nr:phosphonate C-P lyase system protein PhnG [Mycolicibacterium vanbaalenii]CAA0123670.1 Uncharacterised protein [Mycolicibacterium vanbaalenii]
MTPEQRYEALAAADAAALEELADRILAAGVSVSVTNGPESVSAPVRIPMPGDEGNTVVVGHLALTRCSIVVAGTPGDGMRPGCDFAGAVAAAVCDAESERDGALSADVIELCALTQRTVADRRRERADLVAMTKLDVQ